jgi:glycosyltransferase involved in cell wall biosynthesis
MSAGRPVVGTRVVGIQEFIAYDQTGLLVPPNDPSALAQALLRVRRDAGLGPRLADGARAFISTHGRLEDMVKRYADAYEHVLAGRAS